MAANITTLKELIPLLEGVTKAKDFGWLVIQHVPAKPRSLRRQLALAARDHFRHSWTDLALFDLLKPGRHTENRYEAQAACRKVPENKKRRQKTKAAWYDANPDYNSKYWRERRTNDPAFKILGNLRGRLSNAVKTGGTGKSASTMELTGCTLPELMAHLESQFTEGMTWANQGEWHIDHIKPCASFDMMIPEQQRQCFHWTNLQPLWGADNMSKGDRLDWSPNALIEPQVEPTASNI